MIDGSFHLLLGVDVDRLQENQRMYRGVILDIDGTLIDSNMAHASAWSEALKQEAGLSFSTSDLLPLIGMGGDKLLPSLTGIDEQSDLGQRISKARGKIFKEKYLSSLRAFPGAVDLVKRMKSEGLRLGVATSASQEDMKALLKILQIENLLEEKVSKDEAKNSKPDPDGILSALAKLELEAHEVLMLGDTPYDISAASKAGVGSVVVKTGIWTSVDLAGALEIYLDPEDLLENFESSAFKKSAADLLFLNQPDIQAKDA